MPLDYLKVATARRLAIDYIAPPICEGDFSSTGSPFISLLPLLGPASPTGLVAEGMGGRFNLRWDNVPGVLCWSVYRANDREDPYGDYTLIAECVNDSTIPLDPGCYRIAAITQDGVSELSDPVCYDKPEEPEPVCPTWVRPPSETITVEDQQTIWYNILAAGDAPIAYSILKDGEVLHVGMPWAFGPLHESDSGDYIARAEHPGCAPLDFPFSITVNPPVPIDPCAPDPWEDFGSVPDAFTSEVITYDVDIPAPAPHLDFSQPYTPNIVTVGTWPAGARWTIDVSYLSGDWTAGSKVTGFGLRAFWNGEPYSLRMTDCSLIGTDRPTVQAALAEESFFVLETPMSAGAEYGLAIDLTKISWADGQLGSTDPANPNFDPSLLCTDKFATVSSGSIASTLRMRVQFSRDTTPPFTQAQIRDWPTIAARPDLVIPATMPGPMGPETYAFNPIEGTEWDGRLLCSDTSETQWTMYMSDCEGQPLISPATVRALRLFGATGASIAWSPHYVNAAGTLIASPAWCLLIEIQDSNYGADFVLWAGLKLTGATPAGTYQFINRYPFNLIEGGAPWTNPDQTDAFWMGLACVKVDAI